MTENLEQRDSDEEWIYSYARKIGRRPTEAAVFAFCERTSELVGTGLDVAAARRKAFSEYFS